MSVYITVDGLEWVVNGGMFGHVGASIHVYLLADDPGTSPHIDFSELDLWPDQIGAPEIVGDWVVTEAGHTLRGTPLAITVSSSSDTQPWGYAVCYLTGPCLYWERREFDWGPGEMGGYDSILTTNLALSGCQT